MFAIKLAYVCGTEKRFTFVNVARQVAASVVRKCPTLETAAHFLHIRVINQFPLPVVAPHEMAFEAVIGGCVPDAFDNEVVAHGFPFVFEFAGAEIDGPLQVPGVGFPAGQLFFAADAVQLHGRFAAKGPLNMGHLVGAVLMKFVVKSEEAGRQLGVGSGPGAGRCGLVLAGIEERQNGKNNDRKFQVAHSCDVDELVCAKVRRVNGNDGLLFSWALL